ncbi:MAG TPA: RasGEF domain-containing protein, partial [Parachlamydiaceae bacterium]|nr:RasGEF domain-containing protein [Parachlamydiaceae bacterium]
SRDVSPRKKKSSPRDLLSAPIVQSERIGNNVKFALRSSVVGSDSEKEICQFTHLLDKDLIKERIRNQKLLLNSFYCLKRVVANPLLGLHLDSANSLSCKHKKREYDPLEKQRILSFLYAIMIDAISLKNTVFFTNKNLLVSLENLDELIKTLFPERDGNIELIRSSLLLAMQRCFEKDKKNLHLPSISALENANISLFHTNTPFFQLKKLDSPEDENMNNESKLIAILESKKNDMEELINHVTCFINRPESEITYLEKISALNFYKSRVNNYHLFLEFHKTWASNTSINDRVLKSGNIRKDKLKINMDAPFNTNSFLLRLSDEIDYLTLGLSFEYDKYYDGLMNINSFLNELMTSDVNNAEMHQFLDIISSDMKMGSAQTMNLMTFDTCMLSTSSKYPSESICYCNSVANYVYKNFNYLIKNFRSSLKDIKPHNFVDNYFKLYMFFVNLGVELIKKNDYLSSMAIYTTLENSSISWIMGRKDVHVPVNFQENLQIFRSTMNPYDHYGNLRKIMEESRKNKIFHVPSFTIYTTFIHEYEKLSLLKESSQAKSLQIKNVDDYFNELRFNFESAAKNYAAQSNIMAEISSCTHPIEPLKPDIDITATFLKKCTTNAS